MTNKIRVYDVFMTIHPNDGIDNLISSLQSAKEAETKGEWTSLIVDYDSDDEYQIAQWYIKGYREETNIEYQKRMKELEKIKQFKNKQKQDKEERDKKEYERLKKKYGEK